MTVPYDTMDVPGIMELHRYVAQNLMNEKHNIFMWTIDKYLPDAEKIMEMLGYRLHARIIWDKVNGPAPAYTLRFSHEYLLWFFKKGNIILPEKDKRGAYTTVMRESSRRHSQKPECAYQMLESLFPQAEKLELFARTERDGWDQWGNEL
jgi:N6-adenosine-specific RNA methylase IME4